MSKTTDDPTPSIAPDPVAQARARIAEMSRLFADIRELVDQWLVAEGPASKANTLKMITKLGELQTAHLMVMKAEEVFHEKFNQDTAGPGIDYDAVRRDIGSALDRIRAAISPDGLSE